MSEERALSPEQEERIRRLLVEARVEDPMPDSVATRLDRVIAQLAPTHDGDPHDTGSESDVGPTDDSPTDDSHTVIELAARRRRRVGRLLVAAAAVVVLGVGASQVLPSLEGSDDHTTAADDSAGAAAVAPDTTVSELQAENEAAEAPAPTVPEALMAQGLPPKVRAVSFTHDVRRIRSTAMSSYAADDQSATSGAAGGRTMFDCGQAPWGQGQLVAVLYQASPAVLAFRPPMGESQVVELLECGTAQILRSVTLPAR